MAAAATPPPVESPPPSQTAAVTVIVSDEEFLVARALEDLSMRLSAGVVSVEVTHLQAADLTAADVMDLRTPSLFGDRRLVVVHDLAALPEPFSAALADHVQNPLAEVFLALVAAPATQRKLVDALAKDGAEVVRPARPSRPTERRNFVQAEARRRGVALSGRATDALLESVGTDLRELATAVDQLAESASSARIDEELILRYYRGRAETTGFAVADAALSGDARQALQLLRQALDAGTAPLLITSAMASGLRDVARVRAAAGLSPSEIAKRLQLPDWKLERILRRGRSWTDAGVAAALRAVAAADLDVKGAGADDAYVLERLVLAVAEARMPPASTRG
ncbi:MAG: DNA polymerase III subunit delta [Frankiaceae bacterium]